MQSDRRLGFVIEPHAIHPHDNLEPGHFLSSEECLPEQVSARTCAAESLGVKADAVLPDPQDLAVVVRQRLDCCMGQRGPWSQQEHRQRRCRDGGGCPVSPVHGDGSVLLLDDGMLDVEIRQLVVESRQVVERLFFVQLSKIS